MSKFNLFESVILNRDLPEHGLKKGTRGAVVDLLLNNGVAVELFDSKGETIEVVLEHQSFFTRAPRRGKQLLGHIDEAKEE